MCGAEPQAEHPSERSERHNAFVSTFFKCWCVGYNHDLTCLLLLCFFSVSLAIIRLPLKLIPKFPGADYSIISPPSGGMMLVR